jgi:hypothetical protein
LIIEDIEDWLMVITTDPIDAHPDVAGGLRHSRPGAAEAG